MSIHVNSSLAVALVQSRLLGDTKGGPFNDIETVGGHPAGMTINVDNPINSVQVLYGAVVDGLAITYNETNGATTTVYHGTEPGSSDTTLQKGSFNVANDENIIAISGKAGVHPVYGTRICKISFAIYNRTSGQISVAGPYGSSNDGSSFRVTANGAFVSFGGYAETSNDSIAQATNAGREGGLYGLTFFDVDYRQV
jgi:hypothetical protein